MKTRIVVVIILLLTLAVLLTKNNDSVSNMLLGLINPIKKNYKNITQDIENYNNGINLKTSFCIPKNYKQLFKEKPELEDKKVCPFYNVCNHFLCEYEHKKDTWIEKELKGGLDEREIEKLEVSLNFSKFLLFFMISIMA